MPDHPDSETWNILHVARPAQVGGTITSTLRQAQAEFDTGRKVRVLSLIQRQKDAFLEMARQFTVPARLVSEYECALRLAALRFSPGQGIVHLHSGRSTLSPKVRLTRRLIPARIPLVVSLHETSRWVARDQPQWRDAHVRLHPETAAVVVPSDAEREAQILRGIPEEKVFVVPDIVHEQKGERGDLRRELGLSNTTPLVLFCGRVVPEKGPLRTIEAFRIVLHARPDCVLVVAGDGQQLDLCRQSAHGLGNRVRFLGHVSDVGRLYADCDAFVAPSTGESFGIAAIEAAFAGVPMVLSRIRPWTDVFKEGECLFIDIEDTQSLASCILRILADPQIAKEMANSAQVSVRDRYSRHSTVAALTRTYQFALQRSPAGNLFKARDRI